MKSKSLISGDRSRRIARFVDQLGLYVARRCVESNLPTSPVDPFMTEVFTKMVRSRQRCEVLDLLELLVNDEWCDRLFDGFRARMLP